MWRKNFCRIAVLIIVATTLIPLNLPRQISNPLPAEASSCIIEIFTQNPSSPVQVGTHVTLYMKGNCGTARFEINGAPRAEIGAPEQTETWKTEEFGAGTYNVCAVLRGDGGWESADKKCTTYEVTGSSTSTCSIEFFNASPSSPVVVGTHVSLHGKGNCGTARFEINDVPRAEIGAPEQTETWKTEEFGVGTYKVCFALRGDGGWENAARSCKIYEVSSNSTIPVDCSVQSFRVSPGGGLPGTIFTFSGSGTCNVGVRAVRFLIDGTPFGEIGASSQTVTWNSSGFSEGNHTISFQVTAGEWSEASTSTITIDLSGSGTSDPVDGSPTDNPPSIPPSDLNTIWDGYSTPPSENYVVVNVDGLRIRNGAGKDYPKLGYARQGSFYPLLELRGEWAKISTLKGVGWIYTGSGYATVYTNSLSGDNEPSVEPIDDYEVNVRLSPSVRSRIMGSIFPNQKFHVIGRNLSGTWLQIQFGEARGWVCTSYAKDNGLLSSIPVTNGTHEDCSGNVVSTSIFGEPIVFPLYSDDQLEPVLIWFDALLETGQLTQEQLLSIVENSIQASVSCVALGIEAAPLLIALFGVVTFQPEITLASLTIAVIEVSVIPTLPETAASCAIDLWDYWHEIPRQ